MKAAGIICEFNPLHDGHRFLLDSVRSVLKPDAVVCVMSGNFVQRGKPSLWNKYRRADMAIKAGADLVLELPVRYALGCASDFASGGVSVLDALGCISHIAFGSECGDIEILKSAASVSEDEFKDKLRELLDSGISYPDAYSKACGNPVFNTPNNTLGVEYIRALNKTGSDMIPFTIKRLEGVCASEIRENIESNDNINYVDYIDIQKFEVNQFAALRYKLLNTSAEELNCISEVTEGLENKILKEFIYASDLEDLIQRVKSKRYTYSKISRIMLKILLGISKSDMQKPLDSIKVLALNNVGREVLKSAKNAEIKFSVSAEDSSANDLYSVLCGNTIYDNSDYVCNPKPADI